MIIDFHAHITSEWEASDTCISVEESLHRMDVLGIDISCSSNARDLIGDWEAGNRRLYEATKKYPDRIIGFGVYNPHFPHRIPDEMKRCTEEYGFKGIKVHWSHTGVYYDDPMYIPIYELAMKYKLPVLGHGSDGARSFEKPAQMFPELTFVAGHAGGFQWAHATKLAAKYPNLFLEINYSLTDYGMIEHMVRGAGAEKILFGTDLPLMEPATSIAKVKYADISEEDKEKIFCKNAANILGLDIKEEVQ